VSRKPGAIQLFDLDKPDMDLFKTFHENLQKTIQESAEWPEHANANSKKNSYEAAKNGDAGYGARQSDTGGLADMESDIPF